ncbi:MAG: NINE protein [Pseudomonadota bacterium]
MADYHGDMMYEVGNVYERVDDRNYPVAIILLLLFGAIGIHRLYLNDRSIGFLYFGCFAATVFIGILTFNFTLLTWYLGLASLALFGEFIYFIYKWLDRSRS